MLTPGWIFIYLLGLTLTFVVVALFCARFKEWWDKRRKFREALEYVVYLFQYPGSPTEKPHHFYSSGEASLSNIIREYANVKGCEVDTAQTKALLDGLIKELGYEIQYVVPTRHEKIIFNKKSL